MKEKTGKYKKFKSIFVVTAALLVLVFIVLLSVRLITGKSLGLIRIANNIVYTITNPVRAVFGSSDIAHSSQGDFSNVVFLHHSVGNELIGYGKVRETLREHGYVLWDHEYNFNGLRDPDGNYTGYSYNVPQDNTDPDGLAEIFHQKEYSLPVNTFSGLLQHDVIVFKPCFAPANNITTEGQLERYKEWYREIRDSMDAHPEKVFVVLTIPPINPVSTNPVEAARAREFANYLISDEYLSGHPNVFTFDFYDYLAESDPESPDFNMLREDYREGSDSHPNPKAHEYIGPLFSDFIIKNIQGYQAGQ